MDLEEELKSGIAILGVGIMNLLLLVTLVFPHKVMGWFLSVFAN